MKIIFLDFDGVITTPESGFKLCPEKMKLLEKIIDHTDARIVISSSWRRYSLSDTIKTITDKSNPFVGNNPFSMPERVIGVTSQIYAFKHGSRDFHYRIQRGVEIYQWLKEHDDVDAYVILDDDRDMLLSQAPHFIQVNGDIGLCENNVELAIQVLNKITL